MRTTKELLTIVDENLEHLDGSGLCWLVVRLWVWYDISLEEKEFLHDFIKKNKPSRWTSWYLIVHPKRGFYWSRGSIKPRRRWLRKHINKL